MNEGGVVVRWNTNDGRMIREFMKLGDAFAACNAGDVYSITVWGTELDKLRNTFTGLPDRPEMNSVMWYGDHAKFIIANLY